LLDGKALLDGMALMTGSRCPTGAKRGNQIRAGEAELLEFKRLPSGTKRASAHVMSNIVSFRDLEVWHLSMDLVDCVIADLKAMPRIEFDLRRQMQRATISIPSNIAEGWRRKKRRGAYQNHVSISMGSQGELETQFEIAFRNGFLKRETCAKSLELSARVGSMLNRLHDSLD
jgi:four helix bundle protein